MPHGKRFFMVFKDGRPAVCIDLQTAGRYIFLYKKRRAPKRGRGALLRP